MSRAHKFAISAYLCALILTAFSVFDLSSSIMMKDQVEAPNFVRVDSKNPSKVLFLHVPVGYDAAEVLALMEQQQGLVCLDCWLSGAQQVTVSTVQAHGEAKAEKEARHAGIVAALMVTYPKTGDCP